MASWTRPGRRSTTSTGTTRSCKDGMAPAAPCRRPAPHPWRRDGSYENIEILDGDTGTDGRAGGRRGLRQAAAVGRRRQSQGGRGQGESRGRSEEGARRRGKGYGPCRGALQE